MLPSLGIVFGISFTGLWALYVLSDYGTTISYDFMATNRKIAPFSKKKVLIYGATKFFRSPMFDEELIRGSCGQEIADFCSYTNNKSRSHEADAWVYHNRDFNQKLMENKSNAQVHVMFTKESPAHETIRFKPDTINWTMTFRRDSDIFYPYSVFVPAIFSTKMNNDTIWNMKNNNFSTSWMVSNCKTKNKRMELALKAKKLGLNLDIFGRCGKTINECPRYSQDRDTCATELLKKYYFYIAFENSNCQDYVTEKFYKAMRFFYAVPIVIKREIYTNLGFPPKSFIALDDFASIEELVSFLNRLKLNKTEYLSYHEWRNNYEIKVTSSGTGFCALCNRLRTPIQKNKSYSDLKKWFSTSQCDNSYAFKYL